MNRNERAAQAWPVLAFAAQNRQIITYEILGGVVGVPQFALAQILGLIQDRCLEHKWPALTSIVVNKDSGLPGTGFFAASDVPQEQQRVFQHDWGKVKSVQPEDFETVQS